MFLCCSSSRLGDRARISLASWIESCSRRVKSYTLDGEMCLQSCGGVDVLEFMFIFSDICWILRFDASEALLATEKIRMNSESEEEL